MKKKNVIKLTKAMANKDKIIISQEVEGYGYYVLQNKADYRPSIKKHAIWFGGIPYGWK